jgi:hypothetical protein
MGKINAEWHKKNRMPENASFEDRIEWHRKHNKNCKCRDGEDFPEKLKEEARKRGVKL